MGNDGKSGVHFWGCEGKKEFKSRSQAETVLKRKDRNGRQKVYKCGLCHQYHIGNSINTKRDRRRETKRQDRTDWM